VLPSAPVLRTISVALAFLGALGGRTTARANPAGVVPTAGNPGLGNALHAHVEYSYEIDDANIDREQVGDAAADPLGALPVRNDLKFHQVRQVLTPGAELAFYQNFWISFAVPIVLSQTRELRFASGVNATNSTTVLDGILPAAGFDARAGGGALGGDLVFRGVNRAGVPELRGGVGWAPMNQALDDTKPTWKLGVEGRFSIGRVMQVDPADPGGETGVSTGVHTLRLWTSFDRRFRYFEGWFEASVELPVYVAGDSQFRDPGFGAINTRPGQVAGASFGVETYFVDNPETGSRLGVDLGGRFATHFTGRGYSEMWEVFGYAGGAAGPLALDADPTTAGNQALANPGVSNIETYLEAAGKVALRGRIGRRVTLSALGELVWKSNHVISFTPAGVDLPTCPSGAPRCENDNNDLVSPGTQEVNPLHVQRVDLVGHRYHADNNRGIVLGAEVQILF